MKVLSHPRAPIIFLAYLCATLILMLAGAGIYALSGFAEDLPFLLGKAIPSIIIERAVVTSRNDKEACFALSLHKVAYGKPLKPIFHLEATGSAYSPAIGLFVHRADDRGNRVNEPLQEHLLGLRWRSNYCFEMPGTVANADEVRITGYLIHRRFWGLLTIDEPVPSFTIPAL